MNILFLSNIFDYPFYGPSHCIPEIVRAQAEVDSVFWYNIVRGEKAWKALPYYHDLSEYPNQSISDLPEPFNHPDVIVAESNYPQFESKLGLELLAGEIPYVYVTNGSLTARMTEYINANRKREREKILFDQAFLRKAAAIQYTTEQEYKASGDGWNERHVIIPNGIAMPEKSKSGFHEGRIQGLFIGRLNAYQKGLDLLIDACSLIRSELRNAGFTISIYGPHEHSDEPALRKLAVDRGLEGIVEFPGAVSGEEKERVLLASDVFVMTSRTEGQPIALLEALSYGLPCVVTTGTNMREEIDTFHAGWTADNTPEDIARALLTMLRERDRLAEYSKNARHLAKEYDWRSIARKQHEFYSEIANSR